MSTSRLAIAVSVFLLAACGRESADEFDDPRRNEIRRECGVIAAVKEKACSVSFAELAVNPKAFDGQYIRITGFALNEHGYTYLYASREAYVYGAARGGIDLLLPEDMLSAFGVAASNPQKPVTAIGKFDVMTGRLPGSIGVLSGPGLSFYVDNLPWEAPALPPHE